MEPFAVGSLYDGLRITEVVDVDLDDEFQPYLYQLEDGSQVWIPAESKDVIVV